MEVIKSLLMYYQSLHIRVHSLNSLRLARKLVYGWIFINYSILATQAAFFYSADSYTPQKNFSELSWFAKIFNLLHSDEFVSYYPLFLILVILASAAAFLEKTPRLSAVVVYLLMMNLDNKAQVIMDGGNNLMHLTAFYLMFVNVKPHQSAFSCTLTNLSVLIIKIQVILVYATAGLLKVMGPLWNKGVALYYTMGVAEYGNGPLFSILSQEPLLLSLFTLGTVLFQISLPYLIWLRSWRPYIIAIGTCLHLSISLVMGLFMFGLAMCVSYSFFKEDGEKSLPQEIYQYLKSIRGSKLHETT